ncbi:uncharacterized protein LOC129960185 [Argiope bruennichi]|uniref:uncharacterized protein LOC129960185 n=1 Tax=Argiope bruennichi TaxID=94029 RepID=UPI0024951128|nr:uncharacterized protein LOC129960185 [Argiope bruennichi]
MHFLNVLILIVAMVTNVQPRPPPPVITYFPNQAHPWSIDEDAERMNSIGSYKGSLGYFHDRPFPKNKLGVRFLYPKAQEGFVPADLTALNNVYWWKKRYGSSAAEDVPYYRNEENNMDDTMHNGIKKRDYTAAQLVNMLKALAKTRRQRQIRIAGKGLRFGISK